jgi:accessory gene regulator protein AgrB
MFIVFRWLHWVSQILSGNFTIIIIIIIIIIITVISFVQGNYTYIPETNHVPREHCVAAILVSLFVVLISLVPALTPLYLYVNTFRIVCNAQYDCFL